MAVKKVLIVDDVTTELKRLEQIVVDAGYTAITAASGKDAIDKAREQHPDAVLLDVIMPDMNGFQVCRAIKASDDTKGIPVVIVSSKGEKTDKVWGIEQGAQGYITKPYTADQIVAQLRAL
jgi:twitching motility two-component system response regulator PilH